MTQLNDAQLMQTGLGHHQAGQLQQAEALYRQVLAQQPNHFDALHLLGVVLSQKGELDLAIELLQRAMNLNPNFAQVHCNLGLALKSNGQLDAAVDAFRRSIALNPANAEALNNLGLALKEKGQLDGAIIAYRQAIALRPGYAEAHYNLGSALKDAGRRQEAVAAYRHASDAFRQIVASRPRIAEAHYHLGNALRESGQLDAAIAAYRQAVAVKPDYPEAYVNLGIVLRTLGRLEEGVAAVRQAIAFRPGYPEAHFNLGNALKGQGQPDQAISSYRQAIVLRPNYVEAHYNLGNALYDQRQLDQAISAYKQAIALNPSFADAYINLGNSLKDKGQLDDAITAYRHALTVGGNAPEADSNLVYTLYYHPAYDAHAIGEELRRWNRQHAEPLRGFIKPSGNDRNPNRRLRIGYISPDLRAHPIGRFILPLFANHDKTQVEVFAYADVPTPDWLTQSLRSHVDVWQSISGIADAEVADLVRRDQIDILVDLTMHMANSRLLVFARKPAPVQVSWLAYPGSTGLSAIDYRLSDPYLDLPGMDESIYSEKTIRLPDSFWCYDPLEGREIPVNSLPALETGLITFGCLNNFCKVNDSVLDLWARVMRPVENSRLLVLAHQGSGRQRVRDRLAQEGIDPSRIEFASHQAHRHYLELYHRIDLGLDTFPYNGHTTTCDASWMGVPTVSLVGQTGVGRGGLSILSNIGLPELVGHSQEQYVHIATELARDIPRLIDLRSTLRQKMEQSPLMDAPRFARNIEAAYRQMWQTWCNEQSGKSSQ